MLEFKCRRVGFTHMSEPCAKYVEVIVEGPGVTLDLGHLSVAERRELRANLLETIDNLDVPEVG